jgi:DNA-binding XRE family transcriptional regulator
MTEISKLEFDGTKLKELREFKTLDEVAETLGTSKQNLHAFEKGRANPSAQLLLRICVFFNVPITFFQKNLDIL